MRIGINVLNATPRIGGGWIYIGNVLQALAAVPDDHAYYVFANRESLALIPDDPRFHPIYVRFPPTNKILRIAIEQVLIPILVLAYRLDLTHWFPNYGPLVGARRALVTIHDLLVFKDPRGVGNPVKAAFIKFMIRRTAAAGAHLSPISMAVKTDVLRLLRVTQPAMGVIPCPLTLEFVPPAQAAVAAFRARFGLLPKFWLYVANFFPHKNHVRLLEAHAQALAAGLKPWPLVLRGDGAARREVEATVERLGLAAHVTFLPRLSAAEMATLYGAAEALIFPSLHEGGGIPVMEAMACGCPVLASDLPTNHEFGQGAFTLFDATSVPAMVEAMLAFQADDRGRAEAVAKGLVQARQHALPLIGARLTQIYASFGPRRPG